MTKNWATATTEEVLAIADETVRSGRAPDAPNAPTPPAAPDMSIEPEEEDADPAHRLWGEAEFNEVQAFAEEQARQRLDRDAKATAMFGKPYEDLSYLGQADVRANLAAAEAAATDPDADSLNAWDLDPATFDAIAKAVTGNGYPLTQLPKAQRDIARRYLKDKE